MSDYPDLVHISGNVGQDPVLKETGKGDVVEFSVAVPFAWGDDGNRWYRVTLWKEETQRSVLERVYKGARVVVVGSLRTREEGGRTFYNIAGHRVGIVDWLGGKSSGRPAATRRPARVEEEDDDADF